MEPMSLAQYLYETMVENTVKDPDWSTCRWDIQTDETKLAWSMIALAAYEHIHNK